MCGAYLIIFSYSTTLGHPWIEFEHSTCKEKIYAGSPYNYGHWKNVIYDEKNKIIKTLT